jgi:uncharacterized protein
METISIFVDGAFSSGKTEFIRAISEIEVVSVEPIKKDPSKLSPSLDFGRLTIDDGCVLYFYGRSGSARMLLIEDPNFLQKHRHHCGLIGVVDSVYFEHIQTYSTNRPTDTFIKDHAAIAGIHTIRKRELPFLLVASKQDKEGARSVEEMREVLQLDDNVKLLPCSAKTDPVGVYRAVRELLTMLPQDELVKRAVDRLDGMIG